MPASNRRRSTTSRPAAMSEPRASKTSTSTPVCRAGCGATTSVVPRVLGAATPNSVRSSVSDFWTASVKVCCCWPSARSGSVRRSVSFVRPSLRASRTASRRTALTVASLNVPEARSIRVDAVTTRAAASVASAAVIRPSPSSAMIPNCNSIPTRPSITEVAFVAAVSVASAVSPASPDAEPLRAAMTRPPEPTATVAGASGCSGVASFDVATLCPASPTEQTWNR